MGAVTLEDDRLCAPFLDKLADKLMAETAFSSVRLGISGQTPETLPYKKVIVSDAPQDYFGYRDSREQYLIRSREETAVKLETSLAVLPSVAKSLPEHKAYSETHIDHLLSRYFTNQHACEILPALSVLTSFSKIVEILSACEAASVQTLEERQFKILPIQNGKKFWCAFVIETGLTEYGNEQRKWKLITYLDFARHPIPQEIMQIPFLRRDIYRIAQLSAIYNEEPTLSGIWLVEILHRFSATHLLNTAPIDKMEEIIEEQKGILLTANLGHSESQDGSD